MMGEGERLSAADSTWLHHFVLRRKRAFVCFARTDSSRQLGLM